MCIDADQPTVLKQFSKKVSRATAAHFLFVLSLLNGKDQV